MTWGASKVKSKADDAGISDKMSGAAQTMGDGMKGMGATMSQKMEDSGFKDAAKQAKTNIGT